MSDVMPNFPRLGRTERNLMLNFPRFRLAGRLGELEKKLDKICRPNFGASMAKKVKGSEKLAFDLKGNRS